MKSTSSKDVLFMCNESEVRDLTEKQKIFCDEYLIDLNATRAYKAAYPKVKKDTVAAASAARLLTNVKVKTYIDDRLEELHSERTADAREVLEYLTAVLRGDSESETVVVEGTGEGCSKARRMLKAPDEKERLKAAELLGKYYALFTDKAQVDGELDFKINIDYGGEDEGNNG